MKQPEIEAKLRELGLKGGDLVMLHSSLVSLGGVEGGPAAVVAAFRAVLGPEGTLAAPAFSSLGVIADLVRNAPDAVLSDNPKGMVAAVGAKAAALCLPHWEAATAHGEGTPYPRLAELGGYICLLGVDQDRNTTLHSLEALLELPYLEEVTATRPGPDGQEEHKTFPYYPGPHRDFIALDRYFRENGAMRQLRIGDAEVRLIDTRLMYELGLALGEENPAFVLCENPACADCVRQRAAIFRARMAKESFRLVASSRLAGRYVPEMIENCLAVGIAFLELDYLEGRAAALLPAERLAAVRAELEQAGLAVAALRLPFVPEDAAALAAKAKAAGIGRLVAPLAATELAEPAAAAGIAVSFFNVVEPSRRVKELLGAGSRKFAFNPVGFVRAGEHPFLHSYYRTRLMRSIDQLDLCDGLWQGDPARLARGNGEIKELISISRCRHFAGDLVLGGGAAFPGTLREAADDFVRLLDTM